MFEGEQARHARQKWCAAAKALTGELQIVSVEDVTGFRRKKHCKIGRSHPGRRRHKRFRNIPWDAAVPAFYPIRALVGRATPLPRPGSFAATRHACVPGVIIFCWGESCD